MSSIYELCASCHKAQDAGFKRAHLLIDFERMACTSCHDPHYSKDPALLHANVHPPFEARQCDTCHVVEKR